MAVKIEQGGWVLIFLIGLGLVAYSLNKYGIVDIRGLGSKSSGSAPWRRIPAPRSIPRSRWRFRAKESSDVRVRVNIWVGCVGGLVANGGLDTVPGSIYADKGLKVSFKIIDDWTEGAAALATNNVDIMLTTADVWAKDFGQFQDKGVERARLLHGGLVARRRWRHRRARASTASRTWRARPWPSRPTRRRISCSGTG